MATIADVLAACQRVEQLADQFVDGYEFDGGDGGVYTPNEHERMLIGDAVAGLISDAEILGAIRDWRIAVDLCAAFQSEEGEVRDVA